MTIRHTFCTPDVLVSAPRRSSAIPNSDGSYALYTLSTYSVHDHTEAKEIRLLNLKTGQITLFSDDPNDREASWLHGDQLIWLRGKNGDATEIWIGAADHEAKNGYLAGTLPAPISNLKVKKLDSQSIAVVFSGKTTPGGELHDPGEKLQAPSTAREYETTSVRFWDTYWTQFRNSIFYTTLHRAASETQYKLSTNGFINALMGSGLESPFPDAATGEQKEFDISTQGILFMALNPDVDQALHFTFALYYIPLCHFEENPAPRPKRILVPGCDGSISAVAFAPDGISAALLIAKDADDRYASNEIFISNDIRELGGMIRINVLEAGHEPWKLSPESIKWSNDATKLYITAEQRARVNLFMLPVTSCADARAAPDSCVTELTSGGAINDYYPLTDSLTEKQILVTKTKFADSSIYAIVDSGTGNYNLISSFSKHGSKFGLCESQVSEFYFKGAQEQAVHSWIIKPSFFDSSKIYPLALLIHGGPRSSWADAWSTSWNPLLFAEQGYIVVLPNPTGSIGFGNDFSAAVKGEWGGKAYVDIVNCFEYVESHFPFVDTTRACALGASYGGYLINWIAGQPLAKKFKTLVVHDGVWSLAAVYASDISASVRFDFLGQQWENQSQWDKHDPCRYTGNWTTPMLIIHSSKDYRCNINQGLAAYNVCLQHGIRARFLNFPDENHVVSGRENSLKWHQTVLGWINEFTGIKGGVVLEPAVSEPVLRKSRKVGGILRA